MKKKKPGKKEEKTKTIIESEVRPEKKKRCKRKTENKPKNAPEEALITTYNLANKLNTNVPLATTQRNNVNLATNHIKSIIHKLYSINLYNYLHIFTQFIHNLMKFIYNLMKFIHVLMTMKKMKIRNDTMKLKIIYNIIYLITESIYKMKIMKVTKKMKIRNDTMKFKIIYNIIYLITESNYKMKIMKDTKKMNKLIDTKNMNKSIYRMKNMKKRNQSHEIMKNIYLNLKINYKLTTNELFNPHQKKFNLKRILPLSNYILPRKTKYTLCDFKQKLCTRLFPLSPFLASISNCSLPLVRKNLVAIKSPEQPQYDKREPRVKLQHRSDQQRLHCLHIAQVHLLVDTRDCNDSSKLSSILHKGHLSSIYLSVPKVTLTDRHGMKYNRIFRFLSVQRNPLVPAALLYSRPKSFVALTIACRPAHMKANNFSSPPRSLHP